MPFSIYFHIEENTERQSKRSALDKMLAPDFDNS